MSWYGSTLITLRGYSLGGPSKALNCPVSVARKIVLQFAVRDIGQLTDFQSRPMDAAHRTRPACTGLLNNHVQPVAGGGERVLHVLARISLGEDETQVPVPVRERENPLPDGNGDR